jgi:quinol monooxygenase YgiN
VTTVLLRCRVADFDAWRPEHEASTAARPEVLSYRLWRGVDDPNLVVLIETFESREIVDALLNDPAIQQEMIDHGVDVSSVALDFLDEVGALEG